MEDISCTAKGAGQGDSGAVADAAESDTARDGGADEESASAASLPTTSCSEYYSARIASMLSSRSEFESEREYWTAQSKVHWSELSHQDGTSSSRDQSGVDHRQYFEELQKDAIWGAFCNEVVDVVVGREVGEGAQGVIYEAQVTFDPDVTELLAKEMGLSCGSLDFVVKVMKSGYALEDLHRQWPRGLAALKDLKTERRLFSLYGALVKDLATGRSQFGFVMPKQWGDLRRLIDLRMERNNAKGPPFFEEQARGIMSYIALDMFWLHRMGIIHRDLKAANVLVRGKGNYDLASSNDRGLIFPFVADWECSVGVVGTRFWRAPEVLQQLKDGIPSSKLVLNEETDVYSFAMTCYEIVTGKLPFEGLPFIKTRDAILDGSRPKLPQDINPFIKDIITRCWDPNPSHRPNFSDIYNYVWELSWG